MNFTPTVLSIPPAGGINELDAAALEAVQFDFSLADATFARDGDSLVMEVNGGAIRLTDFFVAEEGTGLPGFVLADGSVVAGADFLVAIDPEFDITTAAGPASSSSPESSGVGTYADDAGSLVDGVGRLGDAASDFWDTARERAPETPAAGANGMRGQDVPPAAPGNTGDPDPGTPDPEIPGPNDPVLPHSAVKAALVGLDTNDNPAVVLPLLDADGNRYDPSEGGYPKSITVEGLDESVYNVEYDNRNGTVTITLKDPSQPSRPENLVIKAEGDEVGYVVSVGTSGSQETRDVEWPGLDGVMNPDVPTTVGGTWSGSTGNHLQGGDFLPDVSGGANNIGTPAYATDGADGKEFHWQLGDSSLSARTDTGNAADATINASVSFGPGGGSFTISNESRVLDSVEHGWVQGSGGYGSYKNLDAGDYEAGLSATVLARGEGAEATVTVTGGEAVIKAGGEGAPAVGDQGQARVSAVNALDGGVVNVTADTVTIDASAAGFSDDPHHAGRPAVVTGVRSDGGSEIDPEHGSGYKNSIEKNSEVTLKGDQVNVTATVTGDTGKQDHSQITYAAVAAADQGHVTITGKNGVNIFVNNEAGGDHLETGGMYGISSGYDLGGMDFPSFEEFVNGGGDTYAYKSYISNLLEMYRHQGGEGKQTQVSVSSEGDVNVGVNLGSHDYHGEAAGIRTSLGDVAVTAGKDVTVSAALGGEHRGDEANRVAAVQAGEGKVTITAGHDVNLNVDSNGRHNSVLHIDTTMRENGAYSYHADSRAHLSGENVNLTGRAGYDGSALNNEIDGISLHHTGSGYKGYKHVSMTVDADETFSVDVAAATNGSGSSASATGINVTIDPEYLERGSVYGADMTIGIKAGNTEITASVEHDGGALPADSSATGINVANTSLYVTGYEGGDASAYGEEYAYQYRDYNMRDAENMSVTAQGGRYNTGINVERDAARHWSEAHAGIAAENLTVNAHGRENTAGDSHSYGVNVVNGTGEESNGSASATLQTGNLEINVSDANKAVGLRAEGNEAVITVRPTVDTGAEGYKYDGYIDGPITVVVNSVITGPEQLNGIAIEAVNGGHVRIDASGQNGYGGFRDGAAFNNTIVLNGDVVAGNDPKLAAQGNVNEAAIEILTGAGHDVVDVNGGIRLGKDGRFTVETGEGNDLIGLGAVSSDTHGRVDINAGDGNDVISMNGGISGADINVSGGAGHDMLVLSAPNSELFNEWYKGWIEDGGLAAIDCESLVIQGVTNPDQLAWLLQQAREAGVNVQLYGPDVNITMAGDVSQLATLSLSGDTGNDMLYLRFDADQGGKAADALGGNKGLSGLEVLLLDMVDDRVEAGLNMGFLDGLLTALSGNNPDAKLALRADQGDALDFAGSGWSTSGGTEIINGISYQVYTRGGQTVYVEYVAPGYSVSGTGGEDSYTAPAAPTVPAAPEGPATGDPVVTENAASYSAVNADKLSGFDLEHRDPVNYYNDRHNADLDYRASVVTAAGAEGEGEILSVGGDGKDVTLSAGGGEPVIGKDADAGVVSGAIALDGARVAVSGETVRVSASADGFGADPTRTGMVTGLRADGGVYDTESNAHDRLMENSQVTVNARGDVDVSVAVTGDTAAQSHTAITYAAVAATAMGQVNVTSEEGGVSITAENLAEGERINDAGTYGIYSGQNLTGRDMASREDFQGRYAGEEYDSYLRQMAYQNMAARNPNGDNTWEFDHGSMQTKVTVNAAENVDVNVNLGSAEHFGNASAVKAQFGDVEINAGGDVNIGATLSGEYRGEKPLSAMSVDNGAVHVNAEGDVNLSLRANGSNLSVVDFRTNYTYPGEGFRPSTVSGENVTIRGEAGGDDVAYHNHISGISSVSETHGYPSSKSNMFVLDAGDEAVIEVSARHNGGSTSAVGVNVAGEHSHEGSYKGLTLVSNAEDVTVSATVTGDAGRPLPQDSKAAGLSVTNGSLQVGGYDGEKATEESYYWNHMGAHYIDTDNEYLTAMNSLNIQAGGARDNYGIEAGASRGGYDEQYGEMHGNTRVVVKAEDLDITVTGGANSGNSSGYGILSSTGVSGDYAKSGWNEVRAASDVVIKANDLNVTVENTVHAVGISADGRGSSVRVMGTGERAGYYNPRYDGVYYEGTSEQDQPVRMVITATVTGGSELLNGIAVEAVNGGMVSINGSAASDYFALNGDVVIGTDLPRDENGHRIGNAAQSAVNMNTGAGNDDIRIGGDVTFYKAGMFRVDTGEGDDSFHVGGAANLGKSAYFTVETGEGNDSVAFDGGIRGDHSGGYLGIDTGDGDDVIAINGGLTNMAEGGYVSISAGDGNDTVALNGAMEGYEYDGREDYGNIAIDGGAGHDVLVLRAPDAETFEAWYGGWLTGGGLGNVSGFESVILYGLDPDKLPQSVLDAVDGSGLTFQVYTGEADFGYLRTIGGEADDILYVRSDSGLDSLGESTLSGDNLGSILLDMADGNAQSFSLEQVLDNALVKSAGADVYIKMDGNDTFLTDAWAANGESVSFKGEDYSVYTAYDTEGAEQQLYVKLLTDI